MAIQIKKKKKKFKNLHRLNSTQKDYKNECQHKHGQYNSTKSMNVHSLQNTN